LAESLGMPLASINALHERELALWMVRGPLWPRRIELMLAQLTAVLAQVHGNRKGLGDFDLFGTRPQATADTAGAGMAMLAGAGLRKLGQGRRAASTTTTTAEQSTP
jgi:hypothetical protein